MLTRRGAVAVAVAAALLAWSCPAGAGHGDPPDGKEWSANGTFETRTVVLAHTHTNTYACRAAECVPGGDVRIEGVLDQTTTISCRLELFTTRTGCGHNSGGGWRFTGHNELLTGPWSFCNGQPTIYDAAHCGEWVDAAPPDTVCATAGEHAHGSGACQPDHAPAPDCSLPHHQGKTLSYAGHNAAGEDATLSVVCPIIPTPTTPPPPPTPTTPPQSSTHACAGKEPLDVEALLSCPTSSPAGRCVALRRPRRTATSTRQTVN